MHTLTETVHNFAPTEPFSTGTVGMIVPTVLSTAQEAYILARFRVTCHL